ncbi:MAG: (Fe-S)-binding protein [Planctomycetaceae bacterium]|nr:(Fe-S)-binding protein [Planctomycetaceae bacterium]
MSQKNRETVDACRYCWMCRHICPLGNATGQERNTARARALGLSMVLRETETLENVIGNVYECSLCGACTKECLTGWNPVAMMLEVRCQAALEGVLPDNIRKLLNNIGKTGSIYAAQTLAPQLVKEIESLPPSADTLLFLGQHALYKNPNGAIAAIRLLKKAGVNFTVHKDEPDSGFALHFLAGAAEETRKAMQNCAKRLNDFKTVIAYEPDDAKLFLREYKEWNIAHTAEVKTWTTFLADLLDSGTLKPKKSDKTYTFQDPAALARDLDETQAARKILSACGVIREVLLHGKDTVLAGHAVMTEYLPETMTLVAENRWNDAVNTDADVLITASSAEYAALKNTQPKTIELLSLEEVLLRCCST